MGMVRQDAAVNAHAIQKHSELRGPREGIGLRSAFAAGGRFAEKSDPGCPGQIVFFGWKFPFEAARSNAKTRARAFGLSTVAHSPAPFCRAPGVCFRAQNCAIVV